jgi:deazaflavin-dependent oxidoreductase (nitroreductase family)
MKLDGEYVPGAWSSSAKQVATYEASGGTRGNTMLGRPVVVITMRGARSGKIRKTPVMKVEHDGCYAVVASVGGAAKNPDWYHNIVTNPEVLVQDGPEPRPYVAHEATGGERDEWWTRAVDAFPNYETYQRKTKRQIPVLVLEPAD